ncbi:MAG: sialate O-acetylesterase [Akkermansiaceae bacterium]
MNTLISYSLFRLPMLAAAVALCLATAQAKDPVKIYILAGQSNMQGKASIEGKGNNTLRHMVTNDPKKEFQSLVNDKGEWVKREDVWIHYDMYPWGGLRHGHLKPGYGSSSGQIGPELGFGHVMGDAEENQVLLIKVAWGGKSLYHDFQPPSIGKYPKPQIPSDAGYYYNQLLNLVKEVTQNIDTLFSRYEGQGVEIAGIGWHQGWNDQYGEGNEANYERNMEAFIKDIRSAEHGLGIPKLPFVIATSGNIDKETPIKGGQRAMADAKKYPDFNGNVAVVDTDKPFGSDKMEFKFYQEGKSKKVGYHWNSQAKSYFNIGRAMASMMNKLERPKLPSHLIAHGRVEGVQLLWQLGREKPKSIDIMRNGKSIGAKLSPMQTTYLDVTALPGANDYKVVLSMPSGKKELSVSCDTSVTNLSAYRSMDGAMLSWKARGKYAAFRIKRDGKVIADNIAADVRSYEDTQAPDKGKVIYSVEPSTGKATPATLVVNRGPSDARGALVYEPFDYPADAEEPQLLTGMSGALGTKGSYVYLSEKNPERAPATLVKSIAYGELPVTGNRGSTNRWSSGGYIELDDSLKKAGLLEDGATMWISYVFIMEKNPKHAHRAGGGGVVTLRTEDMQEGVGLRCGGRQYETVMVREGKERGVRITGARADNPTLVVARITWGKNGEGDSIVPFPNVGPDLKLPEKEGRHFKPAGNIDQTKLSRLVLSGEGQFDEIRIGPTFESVVGGGAQ